MNAEKRRGNFKKRKAESIAKCEAKEKRMALIKQENEAKAKTELVGSEVITPRSRRGKNRRLAMVAAAMALMHVPNGMR